MTHPIVRDRHIVHLVAEVQYKRVLDYAFFVGLENLAPSHGKFHLTGGNLLKFVKVLAIDRQNNLFAAAAHGLLTWLHVALPIFPTFVRNLEFKWVRDYFFVRYLLIYKLTWVLLDYNLDIVSDELKLDIKSNVNVLILETEKCMPIDKGN